MKGARRFTNLGSAVSCCVLYSVKYPGRASFYDYDYEYFFDYVNMIMIMIMISCRVVLSGLRAMQ